MTEPYTIYFAGPLMDHKDLAGNALLGARIDETSEGRYKCVLPQDFEQRKSSPMLIRDRDLQAVMECDLALFNFDGSELDSGTVVEYMYAKTLDVPAVILRTDFRHGGDMRPGADPWNLMASFYPRTRSRHLNGMAWFQESLHQGDDADAVSVRFHERIARVVIELLDEVLTDAPVLDRGSAYAEGIYRWAILLAGGGLAELAQENGSLDGEVRRIVARKIARGLLR